MSWKEEKGAAHFQGCEIAIQPTKNAGVIAADVEDLVALQFEVAVEEFEVAVEGTGQHLHRGDQDVEGLFEQGDGRMEFDFYNERMSATGI